MPESPFRIPGRDRDADGRPRRVGFELEFSGISLDRAIGAVEQAFGERARRLSAVEAEIELADLGRVGIELDWELLKRNAGSAAPGVESELLEWLATVAERVVPVEVVCPPVPLPQLPRLLPLTEALREAGARGTDDSLIAAYGVHVNTSAPDLQCNTLWHYLRAYALLQWWLVEAHAVDPARRLSPYVDLYPEAYVRALCLQPPASLAALIDAYLEHNPTRNRALDMLPLFSELDCARVQAVVDDPRIKARPAFHYRLPNCLVDRPGWSLAESWNRWWIIEQLARQPAALDDLSARFLDAHRSVVGVSRRQWTEQVQQWLEDHALA